MFECLRLGFATEHSLSESAISSEVRIRRVALDQPVFLPSAVSGQPPLNCLSDSHRESVSAFWQEQVSWFRSAPQIGHRP